MKYFTIAILSTLFSLSVMAQGEKSSPNIDCCHTGLCKSDIPLCPGVSRKAEKREMTPKKVEQAKAHGSKAVSE